MTWDFERAAAKKTILVAGNFNILHPGHIRLLRFAKECGEHLIVAVNADSLISQDGYLDEQHRLEVVASLEFVDDAFISTQPVQSLIKVIKPWAVVKGSEHENKYNPEKEVLEEIGGKLIFCSGNSRYRSFSFLKSSANHVPIDPNLANGYLQRHGTNIARLKSIVGNFEKKNIIVIGDTIVDQYVQCTAVGMSQEDPTIVVTPDESKLFIGGAGIVAAHAKRLGACKVDYLSVVGPDKYGTFVCDTLTQYGVTPHLFKDDTRPTSLKTRYRVGSKTMLRVNDLRSHEINESLRNSIIDLVNERMGKVDLLLFSDFNYGILPQSLVDQLMQMTKQQDVMVAADSQTSSQVGDISRFVDCDLLTPTEREVRVALKNDKDGLVVLAKKLTDIARCKNLLITLAEEGVLIHRPESSHSWENDRIKALSTAVSDPAGAGDCLFITAALALTCGATIWEAAFLGSVAAACQVSTVGNQPLESDKLMIAIDKFT